MHGLGFREYMVHEFIEPFKAKNKIGPDVFCMEQMVERLLQKLFNYL